MNIKKPQLKELLTGKLSSLKIRDIERLEERESEGMELLPQGTPIKQSFWDSPSMDELIESQNIKPVSDVAKIFGNWPGDIDDGFEDMIDRVRHENGV